MPSLLSQSHRPQGKKGEHASNYLTIRRVEPLRDRSISSRDAYMLIYARAVSDDTEAQDSTVMTQSSQCPNGKGKGKAVDLIATPPRRALEVVETLNREHDEACEKHAARYAKYLQFLPKIMNFY